MQRAAMQSATVREPHITVWCGWSSGPHSLNQYLFLLQGLQMGLVELLYLDGNFLSGCAQELVYRI